ncbi:MAG: hypothetical protein QM811_29745 [Pirellulales bacterium]
MSQLLDQAVAKVRDLPDEQQDAIAALILEELEDERRWEDAFAKSPGKLDALLARAKAQVQAGQCRPAGFDER